MFKALSALLVGICLLVAAGTASARTDAATAEALMRQSGLWSQFDGIAAQVRAGVLASIAQGGAKPSAAELERLARHVDEAYAADRLRASALRAIVEGLQPEQLPDLRTWYDSPAGRAASQLEQVAALEQTDPQQVMRQGGALLGGMPADRRALIDRMVVLTRAPESIVQITIDTALAAQHGANSVARPGAGPSPKELRSALDAQRPQMLQAYTRLTLASYAQTYDRLPTADLGRYVEFLDSAAGRHMTEVGLRAYSAAMVEAAVELGRRLPGSRDAARS